MPPGGIRRSSTPYPRTPTIGVPDRGATLSRVRGEAIQNNGRQSVAPGSRNRGSAVRSSSRPPRATHSAAGAWVGRLARFTVELAIQYYLTRERTDAQRPQRRRHDRSPSPRRRRPRERERQDSGPRGGDDPAEALSRLSIQLESTSGIIRGFTHAPPSHQNCEVHAALSANSERLQSAISDCQVEINRVRNREVGRDSHGGGNSPGSRREGRPRDRFSGRERHEGNHVRFNRERSRHRRGHSTPR